MEYLIIFYLLVAIGFLYWIFIRKPEEKPDHNQRVAEIAMQSAQEADELREIVKELYDELYKKKDWIPKPKNKDSEVVNTSRSKSSKSGNKE